VQTLPQEFVALVHLLLETGITQVSVTCRRG
jgi:hypothetical protein